VRAASALRAAALAATSWAAPAHAHLVETGFGPFYDGLAHVALTPSDLLVVLAVALLAGQRGTRAARRAFFLLPLAWLAGGLLGDRWSSPAEIPWLTTVTFLTAGALVAASARIRDALLATLVVAVGLLHGLVNGATLSAGGASAMSLAGTVAGIGVVTAIVSAEVTALRTGWQLVVVRVAGSWIAAAGLLMLGWLLRPGL